MLAAKLLATKAAPLSARQAEIMALAPLDSLLQASSLRQAWEPALAADAKVRGRQPHVRQRRPGPVAGPQRRKLRCEVAEGVRVGEAPCRVTGVITRAGV